MRRDSEGWHALGERWMRAMLPAFALGSATALSSLAACGDPCDDPGACENAVTPTPRPGEPVYGSSFVEAMPMTWGLKREVSQEVFVPGQLGLTQDAWYPQVTRTYYLVTWEHQPDGSLLQREKMCAMDSSPVYVEMPKDVATQVTVFPDRLIDHADMHTWIVHVDVTRPEDLSHDTAVYTLEASDVGPQYDVWGADIEDPVSETCPPDAGAPGWIDQDRDGYPGVTTEVWIDGEYYASTLICQRWLHRSASTTIHFLDQDTYRIQGAMYDIVVDQSQYGTLDEPFPHVLEGEDPEVRWSSNDQTYYIMTSLPDGATCDHVTSALFQ